MSDVTHQANRGFFHKAVLVVSTTARIANALFIGARRIAAIVLLLALIRYLWPTTTSLPEHFVLDIDLSQTLNDSAAPTLIVGPLAATAQPLSILLRKIDQAAHDPKVVGIRVTIGPACCNLVVAQELHDALARFRGESHRPVEAFAYGFGEGSGSMAEYLIATATDHILLQEEGHFSATGLHLEMPFFHTALDRIGVTPHFTKHGSYKAYPETFERDGPSPAHREMLDSIADSLFQSVTAQVAADRHLTSAEIDDALTAAPLNAKDAFARRLVDSTAPSTIATTLKQAPVIAIANYQLPVPPTSATSKRIAVVLASGDISQPGPSRIEGKGINPLALVDKLHALARDPATVAVVLRVDSPGGSATGAAMIDREVRIVAAQKPVVVTMGAYAASGGYWMSSHATKIIADPETLTGSIGAFSGKMDFSKLAENLGVHYYSVDRGAPSSLWSNMSGLSDSQTHSITASIDQIYTNFIDVVASGRKLDPAAVDKIAGGRVWTGAQARDLGLVDQLGGYHEAFEAARHLAGLADNEPVTISFPHNTSISEELTALVGSFVGAHVLAETPVLTEAAQLLALFPPYALTDIARMPPISVE